MAIRVARRYSGIKPSAMMKMNAEAAKHSGLIDLSLGEPDYITPRPVREAHTKATEGGHTHYCPGMGLLELRDAISRWWDENYGLGYSPDEILVTTGGSQASSLALWAMLDPGDEVILIEPFFTFYEAQVTQAGGVPVYCTVSMENNFAPRYEDLKRCITPRTRAVIINSPNNPTGAVYGEDTLLGIAAVAREHDLAVISDELYEAFVYSGRHTPFAFLPGMKERTVTVGGMSKSYAMTGWRIGYAMGDAALLRAMQIIGVVQTLCVSPMVQIASVTALTECESYVDEAWGLFRERVSRAAKEAEQLYGVKCFTPQGGFYLFLDVSGTGMDGYEFAMKMLSEAGVVTVPGEAFGPSSGRYVRIACTVDCDLMSMAIQRMSAALGK